MMRFFAFAATLLILASCSGRPRTVEASAAATPSGPAVAQLDAKRRIRATGLVKALKEYNVQAPQITGQNSRLTLTSLVPSGTAVRAGDTLAEFDDTQQVDAARDAQARYDDLTHQIEQRQAENRSNAEKRAAELHDAQAELGKAGIQLRKGELLNQIEREKNVVKIKAAQDKLESLHKSHALREKADQAALKILELKRERQEIALKRAQRNTERLIMKAPLAGMVALENIWRNGSMGPAQEGDQVYPGQPLLRIFDPEQMELLAFVGEPDGVALKPNAKALVYIDAYPELQFPARFHSASPVAASALGSPIKRFAARFRLEKSDPRLLPDLAAAVVVLGEENP
jgi:multidrug resistance efflux pump